MWEITNKVYGIVRKNSNGIYLKKLADEVGWSEAHTRRALDPLLASGLVRGERRRVQTKNGERMCRVLVCNTQIHKGTTIDFMVHEQIKADPGTTYWQIKEVLGIPGHAVIQSIQRLNNTGLVSVDGVPRNIRYTTINGKQIYPGGGRN